MFLIGPKAKTFFLAAWLLAQASFCFAIDNPDVPDLVADFESRSKKYELVVEKQAQNQEEILKAYVQYGDFLDQELNQAYTALSKQLNANSKQSLLRSQRLWIQFRDAEYNFIDNNWTLDNFGSSSAISRSAYQTAIIKNRVVELLHYLKNYPETNK